MEFPMPPVVASAMPEMTLAIEGLYAACMAITKTFKYTEDAETYLCSPSNAQLLSQNTSLFNTNTQDSNVLFQAQIRV
jgi:hypothetical protein